MIGEGKNSNLTVSWFFFFFFFFFYFFPVSMMSRLLSCFIYLHGGSSYVYR